VSEPTVSPNARLWSERDLRAIEHTGSGRLAVGSPIGRIDPRTRNTALVGANVPEP
jgi:hypothetical protein